MVSVCPKIYRKLTTTQINRVKNITSMVLIDRAFKGVFCNIRDLLK